MMEGDLDLKDEMDHLPMKGNEFICPFLTSIENGEKLRWFYSKKNSDEDNFPVIAIFLWMKQKLERQFKIHN